MKGEYEKRIEEYFVKFLEKSFNEKFEKQNMDNEVYNKIKKELNGLLTTRRKILYTANELGLSENDNLKYIGEIVKYRNDTLAHGNLHDAVNRKIDLIFPLDKIVKRMVSNIVLQEKFLEAYLDVNQRWD